VKSFWWAVRTWIVIAALKREARRKHDCKPEDFQLDQTPFWRCIRCNRRLGDK
jgi:hypothetical protein